MSLWYCSLVSLVIAPSTQIILVGCTQPMIEISFLCVIKEQLGLLLSQDRFYIDTSLRRQRIKNGSALLNTTHSLLNVFVSLIENSNLTVDALKLHNDLQSSGPLPAFQDAQPFMKHDDPAATANTHKSSATFLSGLSDCTNLTFSRVQRLWESNSATHKEV